MVVRSNSNSNSSSAKKGKPSKDNKAAKDTAATGKKNKDLNNERNGGNVKNKKKQEEDESVDDFDSNSDNNDNIANGKGKSKVIKQEKGKKMIKIDEENKDVDNIENEEEEDDFMNAFKSDKKNISSGSNAISSSEVDEEETFKQVMQLLDKVAELNAGNFASSIPSSSGKGPDAVKNLVDGTLESLYKFTRTVADKKYKWRKGGGSMKELSMSNMNEEQVYSALQVYLNPKLQWMRRSVHALFSDSQKALQNRENEDIEQDDSEEEDESSGNDDDESEEESEEDGNEEEEEEEGEEKEMEYNEDDENGDDDEEENEDDEEFDEELPIDDDVDSELDDEFFHVSDMEKFAQQLEMGDEERIKYNEEMKKKNEKKKKIGSKTKEEQLMDVEEESDISYDEKNEGNDDDIDFDEIYDDDGVEGDEDDEIEQDGTKKGYYFEDFFGPKARIKQIEEIRQMRKKTPYELRREERMKEIAELEEENLKSKPWQLKGEVTAKKRPDNSLLEMGDLDVDILAKQAPIITKEHTESIEDIIRKRVREQDFDDVERRKPPEIDADYREDVELSVTKSKEGLGEIYAKEYEQKVLGNLSQEQITLSKTHEEIHDMFQELIHQLDTLSNFYFTPKPSLKRNKDEESGDLRVEKNISSINMEEVIPVAVSASSLKAPEEIQAKQKGLGKSENELSQDERKRLRRQKKDEKKKKQFVNLVENKTVKKFEKKRGREQEYKKSKSNDQDKTNWTSSGQFFQKMQSNAISDSTAASSKKRKVVIHAKLPNQVPKANTLML